MPASASSDCFTNATGQCIEPPSIIAPPACQWALEQLYVPQRCNGRAHCDPTHRRLDNATLSREMLAAFSALEPGLPSPALLPPT